MEKIIKYLKERFGYDPPADTEFYQKIREWETWYTGEEQEFHKTKVNNGLTVTEHQVSRMNMAKKVAEDWADLLMNERTRIDLSEDSATEFLQGKDGNGGVFGENDFWTRINQLTEKTFALGTGALLLRLEQVRVSGDGRLQASPQARIRIDTVTAPNIFPLSWEGDRITEAAFAGTMSVRGESITCLQVHQKKEDGYVISNAWISDRTGKEIHPEGVCREIHTGSREPWFFILKPNLVNHLTSLPLGISVYATSLDILKGLDLCYDSFGMEFILGKKMVFLRKDLMMRDSDGTYYPPQALNRQLFMYIGDRNVDGDLLPQEFNPSLRVQDHTEAIQQHLNYLSCKCGFGDRYYRFDGKTTPATATEVISADAALFRTMHKHEILLEQPLIRLCRELLRIGRDVLNLPVSPETAVTVRFDDSIITDRPSEQKRDMELVAMGLMLNWEFRKKYYGESEETAKARCREVKEYGTDRKSE